MRHVVERRGKGGVVTFYFQPSKTLKALGFSAERLGTDAAKAYARAKLLNDSADGERVTVGVRNGPVLPWNAIANLRTAYDKNLSERIAAGEIKPSTKEDYQPWLDRIVESFGKFQVSEIDADDIQTWLRETRKRSAWNAYHLALVLRNFLKWCHAKKYIAAVPKIVATKPPSRRVKWVISEIRTMVRALDAAGWESLAVGLLVEWCTSQNPCDVWGLPREAYNGASIDVTRSKTGVGGEPIPLWPDVRKRLDGYLRRSPAAVGEPLFRKDKGGGAGVAWVEVTRQRVFARVRDDAGLRPELQMRDLRRTAITEALRLGFSRGQTRGLSRHASEAGMEPYDAMESSGIVLQIQDARNRARKLSNKR